MGIFNRVFDLADWERRVKRFTHSPLLKKLLGDAVHELAILDGVATQLGFPLLVDNIRHWVEQVDAIDGLDGHAKAEKLAEMIADLCGEHWPEISAKLLWLINGAREAAVRTLPRKLDEIQLLLEGAGHADH